MTYTIMHEIHDPCAHVSLGIGPYRTIWNEKLGFCSGTFKQLVSDVTILLGHEKLRKTMGENARKFVEREHQIRKTVEKYMELFESLYE